MVALFFASCKAGGSCAGSPDVCKTPAPPAPPVPIPYPNLSQVASATGQSTKVKIASAPALSVKAKMPMSSGDEAGVAGGVVSGMNMNQVLYKKGSMKVTVEGAALVHQTSITGHNGSNANMPAGQQVAPSQTVVKTA